MQHEQLSMFDLFSQPEESAPAPVHEDAAPVPVMIQASMYCNGAYRLFGVVRSEIIPSSWRPSARDVLNLFPLSISYDISRDMLDRSGVIDLFVHMIDSDGNMLHELADAHITIQASEVCDAAESL